MPWAMIGWSHHRTPVEIRERLAFSKEQVFEILSLFAERYPQVETVLLSTCNRVEFYCAANNQELPPADELGRFVTEYQDVPYAEVQDQVTFLSGVDSLRHLFSVAASLDSMIVGEAQILSQVKTAYELACEGKTASTMMHQAFQRATVVAKRVANETEIHRRRVSVPSVAVSEIATEFFERFDDKRILLLGAGDMGTETLRYLIDAGASKIAIVNRSRERAEILGKQFGAEVAPWDELYPRIATADLIVSTTGASEPVVRLDEFRAARAKQKKGAVLILDLAVPRDFESSIAKLSDVYLYSVDDLQEVCDRNVEARKKEWPRAQEIVEQETQKFLSDSRHRGSGATIKQLRQQAESIKQEELKRLTSRPSIREADAELKKEIEIAFDRLVNKLLHPPLQSLREHSDSSSHASLVDALRRLFQLKYDD